MKVTADAIEQAYRASGNEMGWRFLSCPASNLTGAEMAFIGLNPAGDAPEDRDSFAMPEGKSAYGDESWNRNSPGEAVLQSRCSRSLSD